MDFSVLWDRSKGGFGGRLHAIADCLGLRCNLRRQAKHTDDGRPHSRAPPVTTRRLDPLCILIGLDDLDLDRELD